MEAEGRQTTLPEQVQPVNIEDEMRQSYLDYAMSVIIGRALPDARDGLKPVHRRILYAMHDLGLAHNKPYKKSARLVGEVLGKYHPHGDTAVYDSIIRMVQDFSLRYPLVGGQGNFGSVDGDAAAAMRYTEIRMSRLTQEFLQDIDKETVGFVPNFDESLQEPVVLPARLPNLLVNGASGIAVGMATNIPPHNLGEVIGALVKMIDNPDIKLGELLRSIPGPDFPTAGIIHGRKGILEAYRSGRGVIQLRARAVIEKSGRGERESIVVSELPYQVNKARLIEKIAHLVRNRKIEGITDLRDESDREGMRIVMDLKKDHPAKVVLNQLYAHTQMKTSFGIIMLALVDKQPRVMGLKAMLGEFLDFRREVVIRRTRFVLARAEERVHILEGLKIALAHIDDVVQLIKKSSGPPEAKEALRNKFGLTAEQAQAILEMRLQRLTALEQGKILEELKALKKKISEYRAILKDDVLVFKIIKEELLEVKSLYGDRRRTEIIEEETEVNLEDLIADEDMVITISHQGYIKRNAATLYRSQRRGGKGIIAMEHKLEDFGEQLFIASTHSYLLFFSSLGRLYWLKVHELPQAGRAAKGKAIVNLLPLRKEEKISAVMPVREFEGEKFVVMATARGVIKKTKVSAFSNPRAGGIIALSLDQGDTLIAARLVERGREIFMATSGGKAIRFSEDGIRPTGRTARGVTGIKFASGDSLVGMEVADQDSDILTVTERGYGKRTGVAKYRLQKRAGHGTLNLRITAKNGKVVAILQVRDEDEVMAITQEGKAIRVPAGGISRRGRATQGVRLIDMSSGDKVVSVARLEEKE